MNKLPECTKLEQYPRSFALPSDFSDADCELFNAAFDHALIGRAMWDGQWYFTRLQTHFRASDGNMVVHLSIDPFGFPALTDDLRARLVAEMEAAK